MTVLAAAVPLLLLAVEARARVPELEQHAVEPTLPLPPPVLVPMLPPASEYVPFIKVPAPSLSPPVKAMIEEAIRADDQAQVAAMVKIAIKTQPYDEGEIKALQKAYQDRKAKQAAEKSAADLKRIREAALLQLWKGQVEVGAFRSTGNTSNFGFSAAVKFNRKGINWEHIIQGNADYQEDAGTVSKEQFSGSYQARYTLNDALFTYGKGMYERDKIQGYENRYSLSSGLGYRVIKTKAMTLSIEAGPAIRQTEFVSDPSETSWSVATSLDWAWTISPTMKLTQDASSYIGSDNSTFTSKTALEAGMTKRLKLKLSYQFEHEGSPPDGSLKTDTVSRFTLVYGF
ncbi:DUF481 domain-containing protein [Novosphingobium sp. Rr 2-17]|uniref:DUF481 domain-containing protein n=1 Tax=Novosphingobium sp. Rr 2-17 TaxID=555793 RepID=UPI001ED977E8|nr:DUF481 domain-containing protein [Novosphingobium sp. Rr 2-17]